ncbi:MAG: lytic murein transglycosylase [Bdellovibrio sp.]|nr:lytic murein transglycosylase [Bdellovibrio sp.]
MNLKNCFQILIFLIVGFTSLAQAQLASKFQTDKKWMKQELTRMKLPKNFIKDALENYQPESFESVLKLNLLGFLKPPQHMDLVTAQAVTESSRFLKENRKAFESANKKYQVSSDVISALLWVETRHGDNTGQFHILSVYLHLLQSNRSENRQLLTTMALEQNRSLKTYSSKELKKKMQTRTLKKSEWAREELRALASIHKKGQLNLRTLKGSYAGAFGLAQFIPSSYRDYAKSTTANANPNLMKPKDAILSVAHYLSKHGWKNKKAQDKITALMSYNNSRDYADSILAISKQVNPNGG